MHVAAWPAVLQNLTFAPGSCFQSCRGSTDQAGTVKAGSIRCNSNAESESESRQAVTCMNSASLPCPSCQGTPQSPEEEQYYGITEPLLELVGGMTYATFSDQPVNNPQPSSTSQDHAAASMLVSTNGEFRLSPWQEKHVMLVLGRAEQLQHLRFALCPKRMDESQFWTLYFNLVKHQLPPQAFGLHQASSKLATAASAAVEKDPKDPSTNQERVQSTPSPSSPIASPREVSSTPGPDLDDAQGDWEGEGEYPDDLKEEEEEDEEEEGDPDALDAYLNDLDVGDEGDEGGLDQEEEDDDDEDGLEDFLDKQLED